MRFFSKYQVIFTAPVKLSALEKLFYLSIQNLKLQYKYFSLLFSLNNVLALKMVVKITF